MTVPLRIASRVLPALLLAVAVMLAVVWFVRSNTGMFASTTAAGRAESNAERSEVDFGLAELDPGGAAVPIPSYKRGGIMVLYAGEELRFLVMGDGQLPTLELRVGAAVQLLSGASGIVRIEGPARQPLPTMLHAQGARLSLPGGSPPRVSVKVQVFGVARPAT